jgi:hypothetical protein
MQRPGSRIRNPRRGNLGQPIFTALNFTPLHLQPQLWLDASDLTTITLSGSNVTQWDDKSGNGRNLTQGTAAARPISGTVSQNGLNVLHFESGDVLAHSTASTWNFLHDGTQYLIAQVARFGDVADPNNFAYSLHTSTGSAGVGFSFLYDSRSTLVGRINHSINRGVTGQNAVSNNSTDGLYVGNDFHVFAAVARPSDATAAERSNIITNFNSGDKNNTLTNAVSASNASLALQIGGSGTPIAQYVAEVIIVSGTNADEQSALLLMNYLNNKWRVYP